MKSSPSVSSPSYLDCWQLASPQLQRPLRLIARLCDMSPEEFRFWGPAASYPPNGQRVASGHPTIRASAPKPIPGSCRPALPGAVIHDISFPTT